MDDFKHYTVMLNEAVDALECKDGKIYVDCTLGGGGHSELILKRIYMQNITNLPQEKQNSMKNNENVSSKRIFFKNRTLEMMNMMYPSYIDKNDEKMKENEKMSHIINIAVEFLFKNDFLNKIKNF